MFENLLNQPVSKVLIQDIKKNNLPRAILFSGDDNSGKLTAAFEMSRVLNCKSGDKKFNCQCSSCLQQKALTTFNLMLLGPRDCFLEIAAAKESFLTILKGNQEHLEAARYFFIRSIRKLTLRFNEILWNRDSNINKIGVLMEEINENIEVLDFPHNLPEIEKIEEICEKLVEDCKELEDKYLYNSIPINQIRNLEEWCQTRAESGKKVIIIENADRMLASVRNALLKILEEPPADCVFILLTSKRNAVMETILSRVRTYDFKNRSEETHNDVLDRVFHTDQLMGSINNYLLTYLPVKPEVIKSQADMFYDCIKNRQIPELNEIVTKCGDFSPRVELKIFLNQLALRQRKLQFTQAGSEFCAKNFVLIRQCWENITTYNQKPISALEILLRDMSILNVQMQGVMKNS